jgi:hypothetical protein
MKIRTRHNIFQRAGAAFWQAMDDYPILPFAIVLVLLLIVNTVDAPVGN